MALLDYMECVAEGGGKRVLHLGDESLVNLCLSIEYVIESINPRRLTR